MNFDDIPERAKRRITVQDDGCWYWTGYIMENGYGSLRGDEGKTVLAHRYMFRAVGNILLPGLVIDHTCRVRHCVNPDHLRQVTQKENVDAGDSAKSTIARRAAQTHCKKGHEFDEGNTGYSRINDQYTQRYCKQCKSEYGAARYRSSKREV